MWFIDEPKVNFKFNQKVYVFIEDEDINYIPCTPMDDPSGLFKRSDISGIPNKTWIIYKGLTKYFGHTYMRFEYMDEFVYLGLGALKYMENIQQRDRRTVINGTVTATANTIPKKTKIKFKIKKTNRSVTKRRK